MLQFLLSVVEFTNSLVVAVMQLIILLLHILDFLILSSLFIAHVLLQLLDLPLLLIDDLVRLLNLALQLLKPIIKD